MPIHRKLRSPLLSIINVFIILLLITLSITNALAQEKNVLLADSKKAIKELSYWLSYPYYKRENIEKQNFANVALTKDDSVEAAKLIWQDRLEYAKKFYEKEWNNRIFTCDNYKMPFTYKTFGIKPKDGWSLYISMHGGGGAASAINDQQWENQKKLYQLREGIYLTPRAPTNDWDLWHQSEIDVLFAALIEASIAIEDVNPDKIYIMGYSAGGDGVYSLASRMSDYWAGAGMFAGHPNKTSPIGLRNVPFALYVGELDSSYNRNKVAGEWKILSSELHNKDPQGYTNQVVIVQGKKHWMDGAEKDALPWLSQFKRNTLPNKIIWKQDEVLKKNFYWLSTDLNLAQENDETIASYKNNKIIIEQMPQSKKITIHLNDEMMNLDNPIYLIYENKPMINIKVKRTILILWNTAQQRGDKNLMFNSLINIDHEKILN